MKLFSRELTIDEVIGFIRCQSPELTGDCKGCLFVEAAKDLIAEVERLKAGNNALAANGGKYMKIAGYRYELFEKVSDELEKAELENSALQSTINKLAEQNKRLINRNSKLQEENATLKKALELSEACITDIENSPYTGNSAYSVVAKYRQAQEQEAEK